MNSNVNPMQLIQMMKNGANPQQIAMSMLQERASQNPIMQNLLSLAQQGNTPQIEQIARNIVNERGGNFDEEFKRFRQQTGL